MPSTRMARNKVLTEKTQAGRIELQKNKEVFVLSLVFFLLLAPLSLASGSVEARAQAPQQQSTLSIVQQRRYLKCGVSEGLPGFSYTDSSGEWRGLDVDLCRAVAAAVLGSPQRVRFHPTTAKSRFTVLQSGEIDMLSRNSTWTMQRDTALGLDFTGVNYYDGQGFMVPRNLGVSSASQLNGATVCVSSGTTTELNIADFFRASGMKYKLLAFEKRDEVLAAYEGGRCDVFSTDRSGLYADRLKMRNPAEHVVLPEVISKEPLGPVVRQGDPQWADIVRWTLFAMVNAEELGVSSANVRQEYRQSQNPAVRRLLGTEGSFGQNIGLDKHWAYRIIAGVGNYGEVFERNVGTSTPIGIERGVNQLWNKGGIMYAPPIR